MVVHKIWRVFVTSLLVASCGRASPAAESAPPNAAEIQLTLIECAKGRQPVGTACFRARNRTNTTVTVSFSVEAFYDGEWTEVATSTVSDDPPKAARLVTLPPQSQRDFAWSPVAAQLPPIETTNFRIRANPRAKGAVAPIVTSGFRVDPTSPR